MLSLRSTEVDAALVLAPEQSVHIATRSDDVARLLRAGFVEAPAMIESLVRTPIGLEQRPRTFRKEIRRSLAAWDAARLRLELVTADAFGVARFLDEIYVPLFLPTMYGRGIAPHLANERVAMVALLGEGALVALVRDEKNALVGAALLGPSETEGTRHVLVGAAPEGPIEEGLIYALHDDLAECRRALLVRIAEALALRGRHWFSLGRDLVVVDDGYDGVLLEKLRMADTIAVTFETEHALYAFSGGDRRFIFIGWDRAAKRAVARNHGCDDGRFQRIERLVGGLASD